MRISTLFVASMLVFGATLAVMAASVISTNQRVEAMHRLERLVDDVDRAANDLTYLASDYFLYREIQQRQRWEARFATLEADLSRLALTRPEHQVIVTSMRADQQRLGAVFAEVMATVDRATQVGDPAAAEAAIRVAWSRMAVQSQNIVFDAKQLSQLLDAETDALQQTTVWLTLALLAVVLAYFATNYFIVYRRALRSLAALQRGAAIVGSGNLDYALPVTHDDEIGDLSRAFNQMAANLKTVTASKSELEAEIAVRRQAEMEKAAALAEVQRSRDELEERVQERTAELTAANEALSQREVALRETAERLLASRAQLQVYARRLVEDVENERRTIARELHDEAGQSLTSLKIGLSLLERALRQNVPELAGSVEELRRTADAVATELHNLSRNLRPASLDRLGLVPALRQHIQTYEQQTGIKVELELEEMDQERLPPAAELTLYRIVQEALTNIARHAAATRAGILLRREGAQLIGMVEDDGKGFDVAEAMQRGRLGLVGMCERAEMLGGSFTVESAAGQGTTVFFSLPVTPATPSTPPAPTTASH